MITCKLNDLTEQVKMTDRLRLAVEFLHRQDLETLPPGRIDVDGDTVYALIQEYETVPADQRRFELHKKYIDIQYVVSGKEAIGWITAQKLTMTEEYNQQKDASYGKPDPAADATWTILTQGTLAILYPSDAHAPKVAAGVPAAVKKAVVKVLL